MTDNETENETTEQRILRLEAALYDALDRYDRATDRREYKLKHYWHRRAEEIRTELLPLLGR